MKIHTLLLIFFLTPYYLFAQNDEDSSDKAWPKSASLYYYLIPGEWEPPTVSAYTDHKHLHIETRFNYEDINSVSAFAGYNFESDGKVSLTATPIFGIVAGRSNGFLPGFELNVDYLNFNLYSENEYMLAFKGKDDDYFYSWSQLSSSIIKNVRLGLAAQSLRWYKTKFDIQRGFYAEYSTVNFTFDAFYYNPFTTFNFVIVSATFDF